MPAFYLFDAKQFDAQQMHDNSTLNFYAHIQENDLMTPKFYTSVFTLSIVVGLAFSAPNAIGQTTMKFFATKDNSITSAVSLSGSEQMTNKGAATGLRSLFFGEDTWLVDFDTDAMDTFLQANPGTATWTLNITPIPGGNFIVAPDGNPEVQIMTVESLNDWTEGDGTSGGGGSQYNWATGTAAATHFYASAVHNNGVLDLANSFEWIDPDSGPYTFNRDTPHAPTTSFVGVPALNSFGIDWANNPTPEFVNSANFSWADLEVAQVNTSYAALDMDDAIIDAMITDVNNRGLRFGPLNYSSAPHASKWQVVSKELAGGAFAPFLEVTVTPSVGQDGDFDGDLDVDGADFLKWQRDGLSAADLVLWQANYGTAAPLSASVASVPEPSTLLLMTMAVSAVMCARRGNRSLL